MVWDLAGIALLVVEITVVGVLSVGVEVVVVTATGSDLSLVVGVGFATGVDSLDGVFSTVVVDS